MCEDIGLMMIPERETILHILSSNSDLAEYYFDRLQEGRDELFPIPFIKNIEDESPLHKFFSVSTDD